MNLFINFVLANPEIGIVWLLLVVFSICCHEFCHAWTAVRCGDDTPLVTGHLTLNPLRQMGIMSIIMLLVAGFAWGAVPVNPFKLGSRRNRILTALAGPGCNFALFVIFLILLTAACRFQWPERAVMVFQIGAVLNCALAMLNVLPVPPLDGFAVLRELCPGVGNPRGEWLKGIMIFMLLALFTFSHLIFEFSSWITAAAAGVLLKGMGA